MDALWSAVWGRLDAPLIWGMPRLCIPSPLMEVMELWEAATILVVAVVPVQISELYQVFLDQNVTEESSICNQ